MKINCIEVLKKIKLKATPQRIEVLNYLYNTTSHPNIDSIFNNVRIKFPTISMATVYNTIQKLKENNEILTLNFDEGFSRYDGNVNPHIHIFCEKCKKVFDIFPEDFEKIKNELNDLKLLKEFKITNIDISLKGICRCCNKKK